MKFFSPLGAGGMSEVYRARDSKLNRDVALKVLPDSFANDPERLARFQREAQVLASLNHPNIAHIHGIEDTPSTGSGQATARALVMELVEGPTLADRIAQGAIPLDEALPIAKQIADALEAAHAQGIIHRDLKPANIKVREGGTVKVLDFGLAKSGGGANASNLSMSHTITSPALMTGGGVILGTATYMSPEQAKGKAVDKRTDIWAFGCVFFEMLTGVRAFEGEDVSETIASILRAEPDWKLLPADVPDQIRFLIRRCLEKDRTRRLADFSVARFLLNEVMPVAAVHAAAAPAATLVWRRAAAFGLTAIIAGAIVAAVAHYARPSPASPIVARFSFTLADGQEFTNPGRQLVAVSPDDTKMAYVANQQLWLRPMSDANVRYVYGTLITQGVLNPVFSPDSRWLAFWSANDQTLKRIAVTGGTPVTICPASNPLGMSWGDGGILFGQGAGGIMRCSTDSTEPEQLIHMENGELAHGPQMLPGGELVLFTVATGANRWDAAKIVVQSPGSSERATVIETGADARYLPTGHIVYALSGILYAVPFDVRRLKATAVPVPVIEGIKRGSAQQTGTMQFSVGNRGSLMFIPGEIAPGNAPDQTLALFGEKGGEERLKLRLGSYASPRVSPDGKSVAFESFDGKEASIWVYELSGVNDMRRLTYGGNGRNPVWSHDSQRVAFNSNRDGDGSIYLQKADGTDTAVSLTVAEKGANQVPKSWSRDGKHLLFETSKGPKITLWTYSFQDKKSTLIPDVESSFPIDPAFSPNGLSIAYQSTETGTPQIFVRPFPISGVKNQVTKGGGTKPVWSSDGTQVFYIPPVLYQFEAVTVGTRPSFTIGKSVPRQRGWVEVPGTPRVYDVLPDGKGFISVVRTAQAASAPSRQINVVLNWFEEVKAKVPAGN